VPKVVPGVGFPSTSPMAPSAYTLPGAIPATIPGTTTYPPTSPAGAVVNPPYNYGQSLVPPVKNWKLGVFVKNADVGAVVQSIDPGSAAQVAGINVGDVIVAVSSTRIGEYDGRIVDIADELKRSVDPYGRVSLLIQDVRSRALRSAVVTMTSTSTVLGGTVSLGDRGQLPIGSVLTVQLQNISKPYYEIAGGKAVMRAEGFGPFRFELNYDPRYIDPRDQYQLNAFVSLNNQVFYSLRQVVPLAASSLNQNFNLTLDRGNFQPGATTAPATWLTSTAPGSVSSTVSAGYPSNSNLPGAVNTDALNQVFVSLLGRAPTSREIIAWQSYMQQGHTLNEVAGKIMASPQFRERYANDPAYVQQVIQTLTGRLPNGTEVNYWVARMQALGSPELMIDEILAQKR
ncbi:MAG: YbaY family lipoprotein, partial [Pirellula sp.]